jgi:hypothetical protein
MIAKLDPTLQPGKVDGEPTFLFGFLSAHAFNQGRWAIKSFDCITTRYTRS